MTDTLAGLTRMDLHLNTKYGHTMIVPAGTEVIITVGGDDDDIYIITHGAVQSRPLTFGELLDVIDPNC